MSKTFQLPFIPALDENGDTVSGAELFFFEAETTTPQAAFLDATLETPAAHPVVANSAGFFSELFLSGDLYKIVLRKPDGTLINEVDNYGVDTEVSTSVDVDSNFSDYYGRDANIAPNMTIVVPVASDEELTTPQEGINAVENWRIPPSSTVILQLKDETITHPARIAEYAAETVENVKLQGIAPLVKNIASSGHSVAGTYGNFTATFELDDVTDIKVGHFVYILDNDEFQATVSKRCFVEYDQSRPRWVFTEIQAATPDSSTVPEGFVSTSGTTVTILRRYRNDDGVITYEPSSQVDASDYITAGEVFFVNGQMREIASVPASGPTFELASALTDDLPAQTYWYTLVNKAGTFSQSGTTVTGVGTTFTDYQVGDLMAHDGAFNPIRSIASDTEMTVAVSKTQAAGAKFSIVRVGGAFAGLHPVTAVDAVNSTISFYMRNYYREADMVIPIKGITGGVIKIVRSVLETTGGFGGITVDGNSFTFGDLVVKLPVNLGIGIDAKGQSGFNAGRVTFIGAGGTYGGNIGVDFGVGCVGKIQEMISSASKYSGVRSDNAIVEADYSVQSGNAFYGVLTNNSNTNFNWAHQNGNKSQGYLAATPCNTVADSMRQVGNVSRSVTIQAGSYHLVQFEAVHCGNGPSLINSNGRITGTRVFGGKLPFTVTGGSSEGRASTYSGYTGNGVLIKGGVVDMLRSVVIGGTGAGMTVSNRGSVDFTDAVMKDVASFSVLEEAYVEVSRSNIEPSISLSRGGKVDAVDMKGTLTTNIPLDAIQTNGSIIRT